MLQDSLHMLFHTSFRADWDFHYGAQAVDPTCLQIRTFLRNISRNYVRDSSPLIIIIIIIIIIRAFIYIHHHHSRINIMKVVTLCPRIDRSRDASRNHGTSSRFARHSDSDPHFGATDQQNRHLPQLVWSCATMVGKYLLELSLLLVGMIWHDSTTKCWLLAQLLSHNMFITFVTCVRPSKTHTIAVCKYTPGQCILLNIIEKKQLKLALHGCSYLPWHQISILILCWGSCSQNSLSFVYQCLLMLQRRCRFPLLPGPVALHRCGKDLRFKEPKPNHCLGRCVDHRWSAFCIMRLVCI